VILHFKKEVVETCAEKRKEFLSNMGLWLSEKKTRRIHTLQEVDGNAGFNFLRIPGEAIPRRKISHWEKSIWSEARENTRNPKPI
jgi:RNA-directed DNA polymerase